VFSFIDPCLVGLTRVSGFSVMPIHISVFHLASAATIRQLSEALQK
jgi:hypothetical protein